jgi:hypothetical protein
MDPAKVKVVTEWPAPCNVSELQWFMGFANFYRRFINHFSGTARPLHDLTKAKSAFVWDKQCEAAFIALKTAFTMAPVLKIANPYKQFILECDCLDFALGAVLSQVCEKDGELHPVAFLSHLLVQAELNYEIFDKELLAIITSFKEWQHYLEGNPHRLTDIVDTDYCNLESLMTTKELTRILGCFNFEIIFHPGRQSSKPNALSCRPDLAPPKWERLTFGQLLKPQNLTKDTFTAIAEVDALFVDESVECDNAEKWFHIDVLGIEHDEPANDFIETDPALIESVMKLSPTDQQIA